ncbi:type VII secretion protein EssC [Bacillus sp. DNRA2]|uniref:type VII secretion protein EssC n=1 Tax=Bacillus sp. DNRA2 TaxID=2723053 RepID=UPI00145CFAEC|nr:type VII secretion protein EssC [Bacillus sp. DNRA2]NMD71576.1 type VII secretion protein EssC [Bacillus sp. DNRA2]
MAQRLLLLSCGEQLHKCHLKVNEPKKLTIGNDLSSTITFSNFDYSLSIGWNGESCLVGENQLNVNERLKLKHHDFTMQLFLIESKQPYVYDTTQRYNLTFGSNEFDDVCVKSSTADFIFIREELEAPFKLIVNKGQIFHNYLQTNGDIWLEPGDELYFDGCLVRIGKDSIGILTPESIVQTKLVRLYGENRVFGENYPDYHRSPRIIYRAPEEKRRIAKPSNKPGKPSEQLARTIVPSIVMIVATVLIAFMRTNAIYIIAMLAMTVTTVIFAITSYLKNLKQYRINLKERDSSYRDYLKDKTKELYQARKEQRHSLEYHYPGVDQMRTMAMNVHSRIYEKTMFHHDFLMYRTGLGRAKTSFDIEFNIEEFTQEKDELVEEARAIRSQYLTLDHVPIVTSLMKGPVGYIGSRQLVLEQLQMLVMQLSLFHSYHELQFVTIFPEEEKGTWEWMRWLPHASLRDINVRGFVYHERSRDQVLNSLYQILKERKLAVDEKKNKNEKFYFSPHYVVLITDEKLILDHSVMEYFNEDPRELGVSLVFVQDVMQSLPEHVKTVIDIRDAANGNILLEEGELVNRSFTPDHFPEEFNKEDFSRSLAPLNHLQNLKNSIPESVTFLEMYGVEKVEELSISKRWAKNETYKSLAVPLGLRGKEDLVSLNLHEKAHGPHGLVAGTTGSGKSEIIQSYILSLAVNFHPHEVAFLLIDYKGGGMANLFKNLPHLLGTITNLDGAQSMRALASIKAELQKRQRLFGEYDVNHINQYQKLYKSGEANEPMPHLFLISDEFAELKSEQPEFMKELVSTARIGRSLGIHLILATQKPSGVVDDQIWSNSKFKLALKVQNSSDSMEILKTPDAAEITLPGRSYLQVGNNEIYELFQSAWSGADYIPDKNDEDLQDTTIYAINELGQYDILSDDLSGLSRKKSISKVPTELDAVIDYIQFYTKENNIEELPRPWLPPLPEQVYLNELNSINFNVEWKGPKRPLVATIGLLDQPELQSQVPLTLDLSKEGHIAVYSSPGYGKSTFLQSLVMDLARQNNPEQLNVYLLDFGTNGLLPLSGLPHVADTIMVDEVEKMEKFLRRMANLLKERKQKLSKHGMANISMYEQASDECIANIAIVIDNYEAVRESGFADGFETLITQIAREGVSVGIYLVISAGRQNSLRMSLTSNIKTQIALFLIEQNEARSIVGRTDIQSEELPGRGLVKLETPTLFQTALPAKGEDPLQIISNLQFESKNMADTWNGKRPKPIPMVPDVLLFDELASRVDTVEIVNNSQVTFGVDTNEVKPVPFQIQKVSPFIITGNEYAKTTNVMEILIDSYIEQPGTQVIVIDNDQYNYAGYRDKECVYGQGRDFFLQSLDDILNWFNARRDAVNHLRKSGASSEELMNVYQEMNPVNIVITDHAMLKNKLDSQTEDRFIEVLKQSREYNINFIIASQLQLLEGYDSLSKYLREHGNGLLFNEFKKQNVFNFTNGGSYEKNLKEDEAYYIANNSFVKMKTAKKGGKVNENVQNKRPSYAN